MEDDRVCASCNLQESELPAGSAWFVPSALGVRFRWPRTVRAITSDREGTMTSPKRIEVSHELVKPNRTKASGQLYLRKPSTRDYSRGLRPEYEILATCSFGDIKSADKSLREKFPTGACLSSRMLTGCKCFPSHSRRRPPDTGAGIARCRSFTRNFRRHPRSLVDISRRWR